MKVFATGDERRYNELIERIGDQAQVEFAATISGKPEGFDVIIDLNLDDHPGNLRHYRDLHGKTVLGCAVKKQLAEMVAETGELKCDLFGINALPDFINRNQLEVSVYNRERISKLADLFAKLNWDHLLVEDRVGMVTPRVVFMIINEACYTLQEGTAGKADIDRSMKLGTNYPHGPFEWADLIGVKEVYETLHAIFNDTGDPRYKVCPLLKTQYLKGEPFYS